MRYVRNLLLTVLVSTVFLAAACGGPTYVRDTDVEGLDDPAMSTRLDRKDLERLFSENQQSLTGSMAMGDWRSMSRRGDRPVVAVFSINNETTEHIDEQLNTLLGKFETQLVGSGALSVISHERQRQLAEEMGLQQSAVYDPTQVARMGKMLGAKYFVTGKIFDNTERHKKQRRVQYSLFMQAVEVETSVILWQNEASLTKALIK